MTADTYAKVLSLIRQYGSLRECVRMSEHTGRWGDAEDEREESSRLIDEIAHILGEERRVTSSLSY